MKKDFSKETRSIKLFSKNVRSKILDMAYEAGSNSSHFGGALSIVEIISTLFSYQMKIDKKNPEWNERDRFILSKGHACLAYYAALSEVGYIPEKELKTFEKNGSNLTGHPVKNIKYGIEFSTGSLGIGLSIGIGLALAAKRKKKLNKTYVIVGDGECNEGSIWEGALAAPNFKLDNLFVIVDKNNLQQTGSTNEIMNTENLKDKWLSFGWNVQELDGHDINEILNCFAKEKKQGIPNLIIANTIKGKGFSFSENDNNWHHAVMTKTLYEKAKKELESTDDN
ncbi:MAG: transketolase [Candidatus Pelagibacter sp.]|nr:transketolase [Candidatus Pelagibacter sp.]